MEKQSMYPGVVLVASFTTMLLGPSLPYASGVIHVALLNEFQEDVTMTAWMGSLFSCMFALTGPIASLVINVFDCRTCVVMSGLLMMTGFATSYLVTEIRILFLTYSLIAGLGTGLAQAGSVVIIGYYFPDKPGLVTGISISGVGLGIFIQPPLFQYLMETYGVNGAFLIIGGMTLNACAAGLLMRPPEFERKRTQQAGKGQPSQRKITSICRDLTRFRHVVSNVSFIFFLCSVLCFSIAISTEYLFLPDFFIKQGSTFQEGAFVISASGIGSIGSRVLIGFALTDEKIDSATVYSAVNGIVAICTFLLPLFNTSSVLRIVYGFILGLYTGGTWVFLHTLTLEILGLQDFATGVGATLFSCGVGYLTGPPIAGAILEASGSYYSVFLLSGAMFFSTTVFGFLSTLSKRTLPQRGDLHLNVTIPNKEVAAEAALIEASIRTSETTQTPSECCAANTTEATVMEVLIPTTDRKQKSK
ncbi:monocarboxylate transporter 12-like [Haliotis cracherodii]|uniref:monocarboxylate transporter 12-like n=1 Tax=Haliotis cracherodii TaxID=6455 RepID=UPI0039E9C020